MLQSQTDRESPEGTVEGYQYTVGPSAVKKPCKRMRAHVLNTQYPVVKSVLKKVFGFKLTTDDNDEDCDLYWFDGAVPTEKLGRMKPYQKINHFPGMYELARKSNLARNLNRLRKLFPEEYAFYPQTWLLPSEWTDFANQFGKKQNKTFIVKPEASCQGRGIFLTRRLEDIDRGERYVAQRYLHKPFLIDNLKFDLRIYVLVAGCDPLRIYIHREGLARFATEEYRGPQSSNIADMCMHLTNYAVNKHNPNFVFNDDSETDNVGHKRSLTSTMDMLRDRGFDVDRLWEQIAKSIIKTLVSVQPMLAHTYRSCQPDDFTNSMCFEILGFDVILDHKFKPYVLEVNHAPSFTTDSPLDLKIKQAVIGEALTLMNLKPNLRRKYLTKRKAEVLERTIKGRVRETKEQKDAMYREAQVRRDKYENKHLGGYFKVYPLEDAETYDPYVQASLKHYQIWTGGSKAKVSEDTDRAESKPPIKALPKRNFSEVPTKSLDFTKRRVRAVQPRPSIARSESKEELEQVFNRLSQPKKVYKPQVPAYIPPNLHFDENVRLTSAQPRLENIGASHAASNVDLLARLETLWRERQIDGAMAMNIRSFTGSTKPTTPEQAIRQRIGLASSRPVVYLPTRSFEARSRVRTAAFRTGLNLRLHR
jgi:tubulin polyglutamylase TTLL6/13